MAKRLDGFQLRVEPGAFAPSEVVVTLTLTPTLTLTRTRTLAWQGEWGGALQLYPGSELVDLVTPRSDVVSPRSERR